MNLNSIADVGLPKGKQEKIEMQIETKAFGQRRMGTGKSVGDKCGERENLKKVMDRADRCSYKHIPAHTHTHTQPTSFFAPPTMRNKMM